MTKNWDEICDEEKSFIEWLNRNEKLNKDFFDIIRQTYMQGYAAGFQAKLNYSSEEYLQK